MRRARCSAIRRGSRTTPPPRHPAAARRLRCAVACCAIKGGGCESGTRRQRRQESACSRAACLGTGSCLDRSSRPLPCLGRLRQRVRPTVTPGQPHVGELIGPSRSKPFDHLRERQGSISHARTQSRPAHDCVGHFCLAWKSAINLRDIRSRLGAVLQLIRGCGPMMRIMRARHPFAMIRRLTDSRLALASDALQATAASRRDAR